MEEMRVPGVEWTFATFCRNGTTKQRCTVMAEKRQETESTFLVIEFYLCLEVTKKRTGNLEWDVRWCSTEKKLTT